MNGGEGGGMRGSPSGAAPAVPSGGGGGGGRRRRREARATDTDSKPLYQNRPVKEAAVMLLSTSLIQTPLKLYNNCTSRFRDSRRDTTARRLAERPTASADGIKAGGEHVGKAALSVERFKRYLPVSTSDSS
ncbi:unnamed protein product [Lampetra planeri]